MSLLERVKNQFVESIQVKRQVLERDAGKIVQIAQAMIDSLRGGGKLLICGNGGSAADAQHFAAEMVGRLNFDRDALPAIALTTDTSILTALANDYSFDHVFKKQVEAFGAPGDIFIGLSTSGESKNVINAMVAARAKGMRTVSLLGKNGGEMLELSDFAIVVPSFISQRIQETHITVIHVWCDIIEDTLFSK
ncbi:D-sedoheptulose 7-phosphate isomerase [candidate division KSB1 bacterium]|nr:D-sedoheptulose 7-phosphate isomerase [candidate division KSB1 bacterium]